MAYAERDGSQSQPVVPPATQSLNRIEAARYVGVSPTRFDQLVREKLMPAAKRVGVRRISDVRALDPAFDTFPTEDA